MAILSLYIRVRKAPNLPRSINGYLTPQVRKNKRTLSRAVLSLLRTTHVTSTKWMHSDYCSAISFFTMGNTLYLNMLNTSLRIYKISINFEANALELLENLEYMFFVTFLLHINDLPSVAKFVFLLMIRKIRTINDRNDLPK